MSVHSIAGVRSIDSVKHARIQLAAAYRLAVIHELEEGIDNHFTVTVPGADDRYLILPFGFHWSEARASELMVFDESGATLDGQGVVERSAQCIHAPIHRITGTKVVLHTHQHWTLALNMLQDNRLLPLSQTAAFYHEQVAYDDDYAGIADTIEEGERLAAVLGGKPILFMKNHGVLVVGETIAQAYRRLYRLERICRAQLAAMATQRPLAMMSDEIAARVQSPAPDPGHPPAERERMYFEAMMRVLDRVNPGYED